MTTILGFKEERFSYKDIWERNYGGWISARRLKLSLTVEISQLKKT
jgi:hypothetical protein